MADKNKVSGHIGPHSVSVAMHGPGTVSLSTTQQVVGPGEAKPDHTVSMVKDTGGCKGPECSMVNVKSGKHITLVHTLYPSAILAGTYVIFVVLIRMQEFGHSAIVLVKVLDFVPTEMVFGYLDSTQCLSPTLS